MSTFAAPRRITLRFMSYLLPLILVLGLGIVQLPQPFHIDQAMFTVGAMTLDRGAVLYVDFWDLKPPGIFFFYFLAGRLFGFSEVGIHTLELIWLLALSIVLIRTLRRYFDHPWLSSLVPLSSIAVYYTAARKWELTQVEILVSFPIFVSLWLCSKPWGSKRARALAFFGSGCAAGLAVIFKQVLAPIFVGFWLVSAADGLRQGKLRLRDVVFQQVLPAIAGVAVMLGGLAGWFAARGALDELAWTALIFPLQSLSGIARGRIARIVASQSWFCFVFAPWLLFVGLAMVGFKRRFELITMQLFVWIGIGYAMIMVQKFSWWKYHFLLLFVPTGILAIKGIDVALTHFANGSNFWSRRTLFLTLLLVFPALSAGLYPWGSKAKEVVRSVVSGISWNGPFQRGIDSSYNKHWQEVQFLLSPEARAGPIYVFGDPLLLFLSRRVQAMPEWGGWWECALPSQWRKLPEKLESARPVYVFVSSFFAPLVQKRSPEAVALLEERYLVVRRSQLGTWYQLSSRRGTPAE